MKKKRELDDKTKFLRYLSVLYEVNALFCRKISSIESNIIRNGADSLEKWSAIIDKGKFARAAIMMAYSLGYANHIDFEQFKHYLSRHIKEDEKHV